MSEYPYLAFARNTNGDDPGYRVGVALDELVAWARGNGGSESELRERLEETFDRAEADNA